MIRLATVCLLLVGCTDSPDTVIFAAASTTDVTEAVLAAHPASERLTVSVSASSVLAQQIAAGAPADVFVSADPRWVDWLRTQGVVIHRHQAVATARLVVVGRAEERAGSAFAGRIALADPSHVPAGHYARRGLENLGRWADIQSEVVFAADVRAALVAVYSGAADRAIVYETDVVGRRDIAVLYRFSEMPEIRFVVAEVGQGGSVYDSLTAQAPWRAAGFQTLP